MAVNIVANSEYLEELYKSQNDSFFQSLFNEEFSNKNTFKANDDDVAIDEYRKNGHLYAKLDPLNLNNSNGNIQHKSKNQELIDRLERIYSSDTGFEFIYCETEEKEWLQNTIENRLSYKLSNDEEIKILEQLVFADEFERFLHLKYVGQKRFSLEGCDSFIPMIHRLIHQAVLCTLDEIVIGMAHRGRLNALVNIVGKSPQKIFNEFDDNYTNNDFVTTGDVKYHKGYACQYKADIGDINITLNYNPSHLEIINPVMQGLVRAKQDNDKSVLPVIVHGDAALSGLGVNQAILNMSRTRAYNVGGTIHIVLNNQLGFTNSTVADSRSSHYCTDVAKMINAPVIHVNAEKMDAVMFAIDTAFAYRQKFNKDVFIDLVGFRRHGHNEADDPSITQPVMYEKIKQQKSTGKNYAETLNILEKVEYITERYRESLQNGKHVSNNMMPLNRYDFDPKAINKSKILADKEKLTNLWNKINILPDGFATHSTISKLVANRNEMISNGGIDFGMAETLAYALILENGTDVRITGEDSGRGTFSHRHAVYYDVNSNAEYIPLKNIKNSRFEIFNSILNEEAVLAFEYGYSLNNIKHLTVWEAQFGDFVNGAQVAIDQFISSGETKWGDLSNLTMLLPHGYDGQGPEHSSARIERFLQLSAENNWRIAFPTTAAQFFHAIKRQVDFAEIKPVVIFLSKKLLRSKQSASQLIDFTGDFQKIIPDNKYDKKTVILCTGQIYYDLINLDASIIRIEELYPFPANLTKELKKYKNPNIIFVQEEPYNQGSWLYISDAMSDIKITPVTRPVSAVPAVGSHREDAKQLETIITTVNNLIKQGLS